MNRFETHLPEWLPFFWIDGIIVVHLGSTEPDPCRQNAGVFDPVPLDHVGCCAGNVILFEISCLILFLVGVVFQCSEWLACAFFVTLSVFSVGRKGELK